MENSFLCPVCNNLCSKQAMSCPKCGHPFVNNESGNTIQTQKRELFSNVENETDDSNRWKFLTIISGIIAVGLIIFAVYYFFRGQTSNEVAGTNSAINKTIMATPTATGTLEVEAAIIYSMGGTQAVANDTFYILDKSAEEIINASGHKPQPKDFQRLEPSHRKTEVPPEVLNSLYWLQIVLKYPEYFGDVVPKSLAEIKKQSVKSTNTDLQGKARFEGLEYKRYYIFGMTKTRGGFCVWDLPIEIKEVKQSIILDQKNASTSR